MEYSFQRYLAAKKTVDDRALNLRAWTALARELAAIQAERPLQALEVGAGIGTMVERMLAAGFLRNGVYMAMDEMLENIVQAKVTVGKWAENNAWRAEPEPDGLRLTKASDSVQVIFEDSEIHEFLERNLWHRTWDVLIANAFLDLFDLQGLLARLKGLIRPAGLAYFSINFDGVTIFEPVADHGLEERILAQYHRTMDERTIGAERSGDSQAGRHLFHYLTAEGFELVEAGSADWVIFSRQGIYPADEVYFLHHIIHFFEESLDKNSEISPAELSGWAAMRHAQVERGELVYIAHQMDFLARAPE
ncbi:MAG TPA: hypothetical protein VMS73_01325 [Anaerolineaceae bacterium]|nr:hypothetical protein [Anaerolineaceae bacterium]